jgi:hypothetical protein
MSPKITYWIKVTNLRKSLCKVIIKYVKSPWKLIFSAFVKFAGVRLHEGPPNGFLLARTDLNSQTFHRVKMAPTLSSEPFRHLQDSVMQGCQPRSAQGDPNAVCMRPLLHSKHTQIQHTGTQIALAPSLKPDQCMCTERFLTLDTNALQRNARRNQRVASGSNYGKWKGALKSLFVDLLLLILKFTWKIYKLKLLQ